MRKWSARREGGYRLVPIVLDAASGSATECHLLATSASLCGSFCPPAPPRPAPGCGSV